MITTHATRFANISRFLSLRPARSGRSDRSPAAYLATAGGSSQNRAIRDSFAASFSSLCNLTIMKSLVAHGTSHFHVENTEHALAFNEEDCSKQPRDSRPLCQHANDARVRSRNRFHRTAILHACIEQNTGTNAQQESTLSTATQFFRIAQTSQKARITA